MGTPSVTTRTDDRILVITIDRPEARNAIDLPTAQGIADALDLLDADAGLAVGVLHGAGKGFCAGMDLKAFSATGQKPRIEGRGFGGIVRRSAEKPLVAAVEGFAVAGGLEIALACDLIVAAEDARLAIPEAKLGLVAAGGALRRLPRGLPAPIAAEMAFTGAPLDATRAAELGLINRVTKPGEALDTALELARDIATAAPLALRASKAVLQSQYDWSAGEFWELQAEITEPVLDSEDAREGARAFVERRPAAWSGR